MKLPMVGPMTRATTTEELAAVAGVAGDLGIGPITPVVVSLAKHSIFQLAPLPVVARLRSFGPARARADLARELGIARHLAARDAPIVRPARGIDPGPHLRGRCAMTLWEFMPHRPVASDADAFAIALALRQFHEAFASFGEALPLFSDPIDTVGEMLADRRSVPHVAAADRAFLSGLYVRLREALSGYTYRSVPIHGDAHPGNALLTDGGAVWGDLETACLGPVEQDIACLPASAWPAFGAFDHDLTRCLADLKSLCVVVWCRADQGRGPELDQAAAYHLTLLRERFGQC